MSKRIIVEVSILLLLSCLYLTRAEAFGLKGVEVGAPYNPQAIFSNWQIKSPLCQQCLEGITKMAGVALEIHIASDENLNEIDATFLVNDYVPLRDALIAKYGKPTKAVHAMPMQNNFGAKYRVDVLKWKNAAGDVMTLASNVTGEEGQLTIKSAMYVNADCTDKGI
jgi:hypothetical protein